MPETAFERASLAATRRFRLHSNRIGETFQIDVALPIRPGPAGRPLPVAYVMDANTVFGIAVQAARFLQDGDQARPAIIVGVGYCLDGVVRPKDAYGPLRTRDLSPSIDQNYLDLVTAARNGRPVPEDIRPAGGADDFLDFLIEVVQPFIAARYPVDLADQTLIGSSLGGLFSLYAHFRRPGAFANHVANSPALWWNGGEFMKLPDHHASPVSAAGSAFISVGGEEPNAPPWLMLDNFHRFAERLRSIEGLALTSHIFEGESHTSVIPAALSRGMRTVFARF
jgi:predicted alpha/beta superfamily hydrolase